MYTTGVARVNCAWEDGWHNIRTPLVGVGAHAWGVVTDDSWSAHLIRWYQVMITIMLLILTKRSRSQRLKKRKNVGSFLSGYLNCVTGARISRHFVSVRTEGVILDHLVGWEA